MRSPGSLRRAGEWGARAALAGLLAAALWRSARAETASPVTLRTADTVLAASLERATRSPSVSALELALARVPSRSERHWLRALRGAGVRVQWSGAPSAVALALAPTGEPGGGVRALVWSGDSAAVALGDSVGAVDTVRAPAGASVEANGLVAALGATARGTRATAAVPEAPLRRSALVLGRAGWESKFVATALAEQGWDVRGSAPVAPGVVVRDAGVLPIDTSRYDVVVALDSTAADVAPALARFVVAGGGIVASGSALALPALRDLAPARAGARQPGRILLADDSVSRADLPLRPLAAARGDGVPLARERAGLAVAARRAGLGRILAVGYDESWRWRMLGGEGGAERHARWWSRTAALATTAGRPSDDAALPVSADAAPLAGLYADVGPPVRKASASSGTAAAPPRLPVWMLLLALGALLAETASRRFRGAA